MKRSRIQGQGYCHPFATQNLAQPLSDDGKLVAIKFEKWQILIKSYMRLGCAIAGRYVRLGGNSDDMVSAAMLGICEAVNRIKQGHLKHDNITGYIIHYIHQFCADELRKDCLVPVPQHNNKKIVFSPLTDNITATTDFNIGELYEILEKITKTETEKEIVFLRQQSYTDAEIAGRMNITRSTVTKTRKRLLERFNDVRNNWS